MYYKVLHTVAHNTLKKLLIILEKLVCYKYYFFILFYLKRKFLVTLAYAIDYLYRA